MLMEVKQAECVLGPFQWLVDPEPLTICLFMHWGNSAKRKRLSVDELTLIGSGAGTHRGSIHGIDVDGTSGMGHQRSC